MMKESAAADVETQLFHYYIMRCGGWYHQGYARTPLPENMKVSDHFLWVRLLHLRKVFSHKRALRCYGLL